MVTKKNQSQSYLNHLVYHIISYHIISYHIISYHIISYHNAPSGSIICGEFFDQLRTFQLLREDSAPWSELLFFSLFFLNFNISNSVLCFSICIHSFSVLFSFSSPDAESRACAVSGARFPNPDKLLSCQSIIQPRLVTRCRRRVLRVSAAEQQLHPDASQ